MNEWLTGYLIGIPLVATAWIAICRIYGIDDFDDVLSATAVSVFWPFTLAVSVACLLILPFVWLGRLLASIKIGRRGHLRRRMSKSNR